MPISLLEHYPRRLPPPALVPPATIPPATVPPQRHPTPAAGDPPPSAAAATVLVIDDDADVRQLVTAQLTSEGFVVLVAEDGPSGLVAARAVSPDIIVLDVRMPHMSGFDVCRRLRQEQLTAHVPVLILSAYATPADIKVLGSAVGADNYLLKPYRRADLVDRIQVMLTATA
jgi:DNA-binding response OmpR family regulator